MNAINTEQELIDKNLLHRKPSELPEWALNTVLANYRQQQHLVQTKAKLEQILVLVEENMALPHVIGGRECAQAYIKEVCDCWDQILGRRSRRAVKEELRTKLTELHALMIDPGAPIQCRAISCRNAAVPKPSP